jgi:hypothetical protein
MEWQRQKKNGNSRNENYKLLCCIYMDKESTTERVNLYVFLTLVQMEVIYKIHYQTNWHLTKSPQSAMGNKLGGLHSWSWHGAER